MKKFSSSRLKNIVTLGGLFCCTLSIPAFAEGGASKQPTIIVQATGHEQASPDIAIINLAVQNEGNSADSVLSANNATMNRIIQSLKQDGVEPRDLMTSDLSIYPVDKAENNKKSVGPRYRVSNGLTVRVRDINKAGKIFDEAMKLGVNSVNGISFVNADAKPYLANARKKAVSDAIEKAKTLAEAANVKLGSVITISEENSTNSIMPRLMSAAAPAAQTDSNFAAGELDYKVNVTITFEIGQ
ncbi:SIMPL domain-containing protein [uncultured Bartonella sp.]|uniref:SIMPL domain-containing protein n=1 Tax=uncultured Bartonella sp. TaxID=104108 RepID=UPI00263880C4|nr:SIMPL domain-containing protein [uncultured Bartonella sp.]